MKKNTAGQVIGAQMVSASDGSAFTGPVTCYVTGDGGSQAQGSVGSGACVHKGNGFHTYAPAQAETNYDHIAFTFKGDGAIPVTVQVYTDFPQTGDAFARIGANGSSLTSIPWNSAWDAEVQSECADALNAYDPPTNAEMEARTLAAASYATASALQTVDDAVDAIKAVTDNLPDGGALSSLATASALSTVDSVVDAIKVTTDKLDDTLELDGTVYRFTENALEQAPSGGSGSADWTDDEKTAIRSILGIPASGTTPDDPSTGILDTIRDAVAVVDGNVDSILEDTGTTLPALIDALPTAAENADAVLDEALSGHTTAGTLGKAIADIDAAIGDVPTASETAAAVLSAAQSTPIDANVKAINDVTLTGDGTTDTPWGPA